MSKSQLSRLSDQVPEIKRLQERVVELEGLLTQMREPITEGATPMELTAEQVEAYRSENRVITEPPMPAWAEEENRVLDALCNFYIAALAPAPVPKGKD